MRGLLVTLLLLATLPARAEPLAAVPISRLDQPWWRARHEAKLAEARQGADIVLLGDSITQQLEAPEYGEVWRRYYGGRRVLDLGFVGDATSHLLWRIEHGELTGLRPRGVVILIGANNLGGLRWPADDNLRGIDAVVAATRARLPGTPILLLGVLPSNRGAWVRAQEATIDAGLARRYGGGGVPGVSFVDPSPLFLKPDGGVSTELYRDAPAAALHPSPDGMRRIAALIEPTLAGWLGEHPR